jgi:hypothetical protein
VAKESPRTDSLAVSGRKKMPFPGEFMRFGGVDRLQGLEPRLSTDFMRQPEPVEAVVIDR